MRMAAAFALLLAAPALVSPAPAPAQAVRQADEFARFVRASATLTHEGRKIAFDFIVQSDVPLMRIREPDGMVLAITPLSDLPTLLPYLADVRLSGLWSAMLEWGGPELGHAAAASLDLAYSAYVSGGSRAPNNSAESTARTEARGLLQYADTLRKLGYRGEAIALLREAQATMPRRNDWQRIEWTMVTLRLANTLFAGGEREAGIKLIEAAEIELRGGNYAPNFAINRAALLAEAGRHAEALAAIDAARRAYDAVEEGGNEEDEGDSKLAGSDRQFDWIRACALKGLGREAESKALMARVRSTPEPVDAFFMPIPNLNLWLRADLCLRDREALVKDLVTGAQHGVPSLVAARWLQPDVTLTDPAAEALLKDAQGDPRVVRAMRGKVRRFPPALIPAMNQWRGQKPPAPMPGRNKSSAE